MSRRSTVQVLSCDVDFGASGAPVFVMEGGVPRVVAVVSAKANWDGQKVALAAGVETAIDDLRLRRSDGIAAARAIIPQIRTVGGSGSDTPVRMQGAGAKFLRP